MLLASDLQFCKCSVPALSYSTANIGNVISTGPTLITGSTPNEVFFSTDPEAAGGSTLKQTQKVHVRNISTTDTALNLSAYFENFIDDAPSLNTVSLVSDSALDSSIYFGRVLGFDNSGNPIQVDVTLNGTTEVTSVSTILHFSRVENRLVSSGALVPTNGNVTVKSGSTTLGTIPTGLRTASNEHSMIMEASLDTSTTIATTASDPSGTFSSPRTLATALPFSADLSHVGAPHNQAMWLRETIPPATLGSSAYDQAIMLNWRVV